MKTDWIRVDSGERPEDEEDVLVMSDGDVSVAMYTATREDVGYYYDYIKESEYIDVTHWAHLPEPPREESRGV